MLWEYVGEKVGSEVCFVFSENIIVCVYVCKAQDILLSELVH